MCYYFAYIVRTFSKPISMFHSEHVQLISFELHFFVCLSCSLLSSKTDCPSLSQRWTSSMSPVIRSFANTPCCTIILINNKNKIRQSAACALLCCYDFNAHHAILLSLVLALLLLLLLFRIVLYSDGKMDCELCGRCCVANEATITSADN